MRIWLWVILVACSSLLWGQSIASNKQQIKNVSYTALIDNSNIYDKFYLFLIGSQKEKEESLAFIRQNWQEEFTTMLLDVIYLSKDTWVYRTLFDLLKEKTGQAFGRDFDKWYQWLWNQEQHIFQDYGDFKGIAYSIIDTKFRKYFEGRTTSSQIRLDEVRWGGVVQDGIPPLRNPEMMTVQEAKYLNNGDVVFGIEINGDIRAYPKRILAWHEMFVDEVGGEKVAGVYCTLCGTLILFNTIHEGEHHELGTSGFLYRSNKLMYDKKTQSLWNTIWGRPVIGPLAGKGIELESLSVVTTTWGEWKKRHPDTKVLSLNTGHQRDYSEGAAYRNYFSTDDLMFTIPKLDNRLKNKDEVLIVRAEGYNTDPLAISAKFLKKNEVFHERIGDTDFVVFTDRTGANRVYEVKGISFKSYDRKLTAKDSKGNLWTLEEHQITSATGQILNRLPYHRAFWFGWFAAVPNTRLVY